MDRAAVMVVTLALLIGDVRPARAGMIVGGQNFAPNVNHTTTPEDFDSFGSVSMNGLSSSYLRFVTDSGGVTEYKVTGEIVNGSGQDWSQFSIGLIPGTSTPVSTSLAFDYTTLAPTSSVFTTATSLPYRLDFSGGTLANGQGSTFAFLVNVPDTQYIGQTYFQVTFTATPAAPVAAPAPSGLTLFASAVLPGLSYLGWRRRKQPVTA